jgi:hypothetical protein
MANTHGACSCMDCVGYASCRRRCCCCWRPPAEFVVRLFVWLVPLLLFFVNYGNITRSTTCMTPAEEDYIIIYSERKGSRHCCEQINRHEIETSGGISEIQINAGAFRISAFCISARLVSFVLLTVTRQNIGLYDFRFAVGRIASSLLIGRFSNDVAVTDRAGRFAIGHDL